MTSKDQDKMVESHERALLSYPHHLPEYTAHLKGLIGHLLQKPYNNAQPSEQDLNRVVELSEQLLSRYPSMQTGYTANRREALSFLAIALQRRYKALGQMQDLEKAINLSRENITQGPSLFTHTPTSLIHSLQHHLTLLLLQHLPSNLDETIDVHQRLVNLMTPGTSEHVDALVCLVLVLQTRCKKSLNEADLNKVIIFSDQLLEYRPASNHMILLSDALLMRFDSNGQLADVDKAIHVLKRAVKLSSSRDPQFFDLLARLSDAYAKRYQKSNLANDMTKSITLAKEVLNSPYSSPDEWRIEIALSHRKTRPHTINDIERNITLRSQVLESWPVDHPDRLSTQYELSVALFERYKQGKNPSDLDVAVQLSEDVLEMIPTVSGKDLDFDRVSHYRALLIERSLESQKSSGIDNAIGAYEEGVKNSPQGHPKEIDVSHHLSRVLHSRFSHSSTRSDFLRCVELLDKVLESRPQGHQQRGQTLSDLASILYAQLSMLNGGSEYIERLASLLEELLTLCAPDSPDMACCLAWLSQTIYFRYIALEDPLDLEKALELGERAMGMDPSSGTIASQLSGYYFSRGCDLKRQRDFDRSQELSERAAMLKPSTEQDWPLSDFQWAKDMANRAKLMNLLDTDIRAEIDSSAQPGSTESFSLQEVRALRREGRAALDERIRGFKDRWLKDDLPSPNDNNRSVAAIRENSRVQESAEVKAPVLQRHLQGGLGMLDMGIFSNKFYRLQTSSKLHDASTKEEFDLAFANLASITQSGDGQAISRFQSALSWVAYATLPASKQPWHQAAKAYDTAIELLPQICLFELDFSTRLKTLQSSSTLACDAAAWTLRHDGSLSRAVELLEHARANVLTHALHIRSPFDRVPGGFAKKLTSLSKELRSIEAVDISLSDMTSAEIRRRRHLQADWANIVKEVRKLEGFETFLCPKPYKELAEAAMDGPVVILIGSMYQCSALVLLPDSKIPVHIPLEDINDRDLWKLNIRLSTTLKSLGVKRDRLSEQDQFEQSQSDNQTKNNYEMRRILLELWDNIVEPIFDKLKFEKSNTRRLWWCPTGPFVFLPVHAASNGKQSTMQYAISSYTPNLSTLLAARKAQTVSVGPHKLCVVCQPSVEGKKSLPKAQEETRKIYSIIPPQFLVRISGDILQGDTTEALNEDVQNTNSQNVLDRIGEVSFIHFACHGTQNIKAPFQSALLLDDGPLTVSQIQSIHRPIPASLAFLSACRSAMGDIHQPDEAIHMAAAMLNAGFSSVVGTMWPMSDEDGPIIAEAFYKELMHDGSLDPSRSAHALHKAVQKLKASKVPLARWVTFVHYGA